MPLLGRKGSAVRPLVPRLLQARHRSSSRPGDTGPLGDKAKDYQAVAQPGQRHQAHATQLHLAVLGLRKKSKASKVRGKVKLTLLFLDCATIHLHVELW